MSSTTQDPYFPTRLLIDEGFDNDELRVGVSGKRRRASIVDVNARLSLAATARRAAACVERRGGHGTERVGSREIFVAIL